MRKMATIQKIDAVRDIEGADFIQAYQVGGWWVVGKKHDFEVGQRIIYVEIDSWVPHDIAPFLSKGKEPREYEGVKGQRLRTVRLRKQISQGLLLPMTTMPDKMDHPRELWDMDDNFIDFDVSDLLNIVKYEPPISAQLNGICRSTFPTSWCPKTDQERVQNLKRSIQRWIDDNEQFEVTTKLDGSSMSVGYSPDGEFVVCSRNLMLELDQEGNTFINSALDLDLENKLKSLLEFFPKGFMVQGELVGEGIQKNKEKIKGHKFFVFDIYDVEYGKYVDTLSRDALISDLGLDQVPLLHNYVSLTELGLYTIDDFLAFADGTSYNPEVQREGVVFKEVGGEFSFKVISNDWLIKNE